MILKRRNLPTLSQDMIAYDFGIILPSKDRHLLSKSYIGAKPKSGWGTRINIKKYSLTEFFSRHKYFLKEKFYSAEKFLTVEKFREFLLEEIKMGDDLLICFNYPLLYHIEGDWGHASLIEDVKGDSVILRDPDPKYKNTRKVLLNDLLNALKSHYKGGIWVVGGNN
jgi:hypothetical protein